jgi:hypothetical protein
VASVAEMDGNGAVLFYHSLEICMLLYKYTVFQKFQNMALTFSGISQSCYSVCCIYMYPSVFQFSILFFHGGKSGNSQLGSVEDLILYTYLLFECHGQFYFFVPPLIPRHFSSLAMLV